MGDLDGHRLYLGRSRRLNLRRSHRAPGSRCRLGSRHRQNRRSLRRFAYTRRGRVGGGGSKKAGPWAGYSQSLWTWLPPAVCKPNAVQLRQFLDDFDQLGAHNSWRIEELADADGPYSLVSRGLRALREQDRDRFEQSCAACRTQTRSRSTRRKTIAISVAYTLAERHWG